MRREFSPRVCEATGDSKASLGVDVVAGPPSYGGQAVIEGVVMRGPRFASMSVRDPGGEIVSFVKKADTLSRKSALLRLPVVRGALSFWDSLSLGVEMLMRSADISFPEEEKSSKGALDLSVLIAAVLAVGLFIVFPAVAAPYVAAALKVTGTFWASLVEAFVRVLVLVAYVGSISRLKEIRRVLEYHGAEHKVIWAWENHYREINDRIYLDKWGVPEISEFLASKARFESKLHPRCGTSFLFIVVLVTWVVFLFITPQGVVNRVVARLALLPLTAGLSYEFLKASATREGGFWRLLRAPGMGLQAMTTREPEPEQLEVAADSLARLVEAERGGFR
ncbi:MAG: DUF1385 domain-containing protein [Bacillota bacterium]